MDANKFTRRSQEAIGAAIELATVAGNPSVEPAHLLVGPARPARRHRRRAAARRRSRPAAARGRDGRRCWPSCRRRPGSTVASPGYARPTILTLQSAEQLAESLGDEYISTEHLLVALASVDSPAKDAPRPPPAPPPTALRGAFETVRGSQRVTIPDPESTYEALRSTAST